MKTLNSQRRLAAKVFGVGVNKIWFDPLKINEIKEAITKQDIVDLIREGVIKKKSIAGVKNRAGIHRLKRKKKGRKRGTGKIKIRIHDTMYLQKIRKIRKALRLLKKDNKITKEKYHYLRKIAKAGQIKNVKELEEKIKIKK